jgi:hypothetical protein
MPLCHVMLLSAGQRRLHDLELIVTCNLAGEFCQIEVDRSDRAVEVILIVA